MTSNNNEGNIMTISRAEIQQLMATPEVCECGSVNIGEHISAEWGVWWCRDCPTAWEATAFGGNYLQAAMAGARLVDLERGNTRASEQAAVIIQRIISRQN